MPKLRNSGNDLGKFTQWLGRKCRNHNPLEELGMRDRESRANIYKATEHGEVTVLKEDETTLIYESAGRAFRIKVEEVEPEALPKERVPVGH